MNFQTMSDRSVAEEIGTRIQRRRLALNITQIELSRKAGVARKVIQNIETGANSSIKGLLHVMRALGVIDAFDQILPDLGPSPLELMRLKGRQRKHAFTPRKRSGDKKEIT